MVGKPNTMGSFIVIIIAIVAVLASSINILYSHINEDKLFILVKCRIGGSHSFIVVPYKLSDDITLSFIHSVHKTPQIEIMRAGKEGFYLEEVRFKEYGAGTPGSPSELGGGVMVDEGDFIVYKGIHRPLGRELVLDLKNAINMSIRIEGIIVTSRLCDVVEASIIE